MKKIDLRSVVIGILMATVFFLLTAQNGTNKEGYFDNLVVKNLTVAEEISAGNLLIINKAGITKIDAGSIIISENKAGIRDGMTMIHGGAISTIGKDDKTLVRIGRTVSNDGQIETYNNLGNTAVQISADGKNNGSIWLKYKNGKNSIAAGSGTLYMYNEHGATPVVVLQQNDQGDGILALFDRYGNLGWGESGKK
jgi:hypothetical protein